MKTTKIMTAMALVLALGGVSFAKGALDGKTFAGTEGEAGKDKGEPTSIVFKDGKLRSTACDQYGFGDGAYAAKTAAGVTTYEAETTSAKEGKIKHTGTIKGDTLDGKMVWTKAGQKDIEYWVKGTLKK